MTIKRKLNRLSEYNYSSIGAYFITTNIQDRESVFGEIINGKMELNEYGFIAKRCWNELPDHINNCGLDEFIVMPDHIHGIIFILSQDDDSVTDCNRRPVGNRGFAGNRHACSLQDKTKTNKRPYQKLPVIVGSYKSAVSKLIHLAGKTDFKWQKSYHDRIIRDEDELNRIRKYIIDNPVKWGIDEKNLFYDHV